MDKPKVAIVTGAARGIGRAIAERLMHDGFVVAVADMDEAAARATCEQMVQIAAAGAFPVHVNVTDSASVRQMVATVIERCGQIDVLVNNAGVVGVSGPVVTYTEDEWHRVLAVNLDGTFYCSKTVLPHMLERRSGRIVNIASISGKEGNANMPAYSASKAGVIAFTKGLAKEVLTQGIYVNCVTPSLIQTDMANAVGPEQRAALIAKIPLGRIGQPEEVAALVSWLASPECSFSTGAVFDISGGRATY